MGNKYLNIVREVVLNLIDKDNVTVFLFGSRAGKDFLHDSDIDIGFISKSKLDVMAFSRITEAIEESAVPYHVDLVDFGRTDNYFKDVALKEIEIWNKAKDSSIS